MSEDEYLDLSGIQHFSFCQRQWALIHIEQQWEENERTAEGELMHSRVHNAELSEMRNGVLTVRGIRVSSEKLHISGICDAVEFHRVEEGISLQGRDGSWSVCPVEYKHGRPKSGHEDMLQLCAEAMCLEEMLLCSIPDGSIYYGQTHHREQVALTDELRQEVQEDCKEMFELFRRGYTPKVRRTKSCNACSLKNVCIPELNKTDQVSVYLKRASED